MPTRPSADELRTRIAACLESGRMGQAVAGRLDAQTHEWADRVAIGDLRARRLEALHSNMSDRFADTHAQTDGDDRKPRRC